ncbi:hypothetical protein [Methylocystis sp. SB2]|uniref:hypothetical protein n=1 Tax=Methylocystis sp. (strain SB2) TaxID=743836 RepID=UPI0003F86D27|nr:hypothetical protein [Methylocystis sp. SB2]ULO24589.1 hypothetical protein LNB28_04080 [Methylocystis sp. SB2]
MDFDHKRQECFVQNLRRAIPVSAHARPALLTFLRARGVIGPGSPRLKVIDVFDAGDDRGLMCRFTIAGEVEGRGFVAPLAQLALERRRAVAPNAVRRRHFCRPGA